MILTRCKRGLGASFGLGSGLHLNNILHVNSVPLENLSKELLDYLKDLTNVATVPVFPPSVSPCHGPRGEDR